MNEHSSKTQNNPVTSEQAPLELAVVGAGFAGLYALYRAQASGRSALAFERGGDVGGTWIGVDHPGDRQFGDDMDIQIGTPGVG